MPDDPLQPAKAAAFGLMAPDRPTAASGRRDQRAAAAPSGGGGEPKPEPAPEMTTVRIRMPVDLARRLRAEGQLRGWTASTIGVRAIDGWLRAYGKVAATRETR